MSKIAVISHFGEDFYKYRSNFVKYLERLGHVVLTLIPKDKYWIKNNTLDISIVGYTYRRDWRFFLFILSSFITFYKTFRKNEVDVLFTYKFFPNLVAIPAAKLAGVDKVVATIAGMGFLDKSRNNFLYWPLKFIYLKIINLANFVIVQNHEDMEYLSTKISNSKIFVTSGSGVNTEYFRNDMLPMGTAEDFFGFAIENFRILLFYTRIVRQKGIIELLNAFIQYRNSNPQSKLKLIIAGWIDQKGLKSEMNNLINSSDHIHNIGYLEDVRSLITFSDAIILPSYYPEGIPRSLTESMSLGKAIITTQHKGCKETVIDEVNGYLIKPKSTKSIIDVLYKFESLSFQELSDMGNKSREFCENKFSQIAVYESIRANVISKIL